MLSEPGFFSKKALGQWPAAVKTCWQALISFIFIPRRLLSSHIFMIFYLPAQSSKLLYMQDRIPFSPTLNKLLNNKIEYFCFVVSRARCLLLPSPGSFSFSGGNDKRTRRPRMETKRKRKANSSGSGERKINGNDNFSHHHYNVCRLLPSNEVEIKDRLARVFGIK